MIPLAALVGVMFMVVIGTFAWNSLMIMRRVPRADAFVIILVTGVTVYKDLAIAVIVGVIISALVYAWNAAKRIQASTRPSVRETGALVYDIKGPLFFGSTASFIELFDISNDPKQVILDFAESRIVDQSGLQAIEDIASKYAASNKQIMLRHLSPDCKKLLSRSGQIIIDSEDDPDYGVAVDYSVKIGAMGGGH
jgi:SulP family sulfate permease